MWEFFILDTIPLSDLWFANTHELFFHFLNGALYSKKAFDFDKVQFIYFFFCRFCFWYDIE